MPDAVSTSSVTSKPLPTMPKPFAPEDEAALREALKRCSPSTFEAAVQYRKTGNPEHVPAVVIGVIERFVEPDLRMKLKDADDDLRLIEDLGIDSLTMMEIVILVEDVLTMSINNDELRNLRTVGDVKTFIDCKIRGLALPKPTKFIPIEHVAAVMPIQPPFLFLNEASVSSTAARSTCSATSPALAAPHSSHAPSPLPYEVPSEWATNPQAASSRARSSSAWSPAFEERSGSRSSYRSGRSRSAWRLTSPDDLYPRRC